MNKVLLLLFTSCLYVSGCAQKNESRTAAQANSAVTSGSAKTSETDLGTNQNSTKLRPAQTPPEFLITRSQVGAIKIGMPIDELKKVIPADRLKEVPIYKEGQGYKAYEVRKGAGDAQAALRIEENCEPECRVWRIQVMDPAYRTAVSLGINSSLSAVRQHYPISYLGSGETEIVAVSEKEKLTFILDVSHLPPREVPFLNNKNTPDSVRVLGMYIL